MGDGHLLGRWYCMASVRLAALARQSEVKNLVFASSTEQAVVSLDCRGTVITCLRFATACGHVESPQAGRIYGASSENSSYWRQFIHRLLVRSRTAAWC